jgi:hypothetical protein
MAENHMTETLYVRVTPEMRVALQDDARRLGLSQSDIIRLRLKSPTMTTLTTLMAPQDQQRGR